MEFAISIAAVAMVGVGGVLLYHCWTFILAILCGTIGGMGLLAFSFLTFLAMLSPIYIVFGAVTGDPELLTNIKALAYYWAITGAAAMLMVPALILMEAWDDKFRKSHGPTE